MCSEHAFKHMHGIMHNAMREAMALARSRSRAVLLNNKSRDLAKESRAGNDICVISFVFAPTVATG